MEFLKLYGADLAKKEKKNRKGPAVFYSNGTIKWYRDGILKSGGPAVIKKDGTQIWFLHGLRHRVGGPAIIQKDGYKGWYFKGKKHREDGPADIFSDGAEEWFLNNKLHRANGPAMVYPDGYLQWNLHGEPHREDGPAVIYPDTLDQEIWPEINESLNKSEKVEKEFLIKNTNRAVGTRISHNLYKKYGYEKLDENFLTLNFTGSAGQSFGAFALKGLKLNLKGDAKSLPEVAP